MGASVPEQEPAIEGEPRLKKLLSRVCDLLDRKLFESSVAQAVTAIAATANGLEQSVASLLGVLQRFVGYDLAAVLLAAEKDAYVAVGKDTALAGIQRLVAEAQASRSRAQVLADRAAAFLFYVATAAGVATLAT